MEIRHIVILLWMSPKCRWSLTNNNSFLSLELCLLFVVLMDDFLRLSQHTELEEIEAVLASQELLAFDSVDLRIRLLGG